MHAKVKDLFNPRLTDSRFTWTPRTQDKRALVRHLVSTCVQSLLGFDPVAVLARRTASEGQHLEWGLQASGAHSGGSFTVVCDRFNPFQPRVHLL